MVTFSIFWERGGTGVGQGLGQGKGAEDSVGGTYFSLFRNYRPIGLAFCLHDLISLNYFLQTCQIVMLEAGVLPNEF